MAAPLLQRRRGTALRAECPRPCACCLRLRLNSGQSWCSALHLSCAGGTERALAPSHWLGCAPCVIAQAPGGEGVQLARLARSAAHVGTVLSPCPPVRSGVRTPAESSRRQEIPESCILIHPPAQSGALFASRPAAAALASASVQLALIVLLRPPARVLKLANGGRRRCWWAQGVSRVPRREAEQEVCYFSAHVAMREAARRCPQPPGPPSLDHAVVIHVCPAFARSEYKRRLKVKEKEVKDAAKAAEKARRRQGCRPEAHLIGCARCGAPDSGGAYFRPPRHPRRRQRARRARRRRRSTPR